MADVPDLEPSAVDGRRARRERGRLAVLDAMVDLVQEGHHPPAVELVAERAGVSVASVFRYFDGLDELQDATTARFLERHASLLEVGRIGEGRREARITRFVTARMTLYGSIAPIARFVRARSSQQPHLADSLGQMRRRLAEQVGVHFAPELAGLRPARRSDVIGAVATLTSFEAWDMLRQDLGRSDAGVRRIWTSALDAILG
ncbi:MAG: TetR/AcrR family transcriptional regulator [Ilumatobacteraceae bacterium]